MERREYIAISGGSISLLSGCTSLDVGSSNDTSSGEETVSNSDEDPESRDDDEDDSQGDSDGTRSGHLVIETTSAPAGVDPVKFEETPLSADSNIRELVDTAAEEGDASEYYRDLEDVLELLDEIPEVATDSGFSYVVYDSETLELWAMIEE